MTKLIDRTANEGSISVHAAIAYSILIVENDELLLQRLALAMETRGFKATTAESVAEGLRESNWRHRLRRRRHETG